MIYSKIIDTINNLPGTRAIPDNIRGLPIKTKYITVMNYNSEHSIVGSRHCL